MSQPLVLYSNTHWTSPYVFSCFVALREKGLSFETRDVALDKGEQRQAGYAARTLTARVPALEHGGFVITESMAIVEYLDEAFPETTPMLPASPKDRARARQVMSWIRSDDTLPIREERSSDHIFYEPTKTPLSDKAKAAVAKLFALADALLPEGRTQLFDAFSVADADLAFMLQRLAKNGDAVPARLRAFADAQWARPSVHAFASHPRAPRA